MAPNKRVVAAYRAIGSLGIDESKVKCDKETPQSV